LFEAGGGGKRGIPEEDPVFDAELVTVGCIIFTLGFGTLDVESVDYQLMFRIR